MRTNLNISSYNKIEFRLISVCFIILVLRLVNVINIAHYHHTDIPKYDFTSRGIPFNYLSNYFLPWFFRYMALYVTYIILHFYLLKQLIQKPAKLKPVAIAILLFILLIILWCKCERWLNYYMLSIQYIEHDTAFMRFFYDSIVSVTRITGIFALYTYFKYNSTILQITRRFKPETTLILRDTLVAILILLVALFFLNAPEMPDDYRIMLVLMGVPAIILYTYSSLYFIPSLKKKGKGFLFFWGRFALVALIIFSALCLFFILLLGWQRGHTSLVFFLTFLCVASELFIAIPACWFIYHARTRRLSEITGLRMALGQSTASLDFLRSQINPHFLFNALNTLYGTALQENADRTGEGIQKLGDMMRFMLQENVQEQISLMREVDYLNNYIALQKLRTQASTDILIQTQIDESVNGLQIAPMLLIPFVENAFKHGISLREPSHIKIILHTDGLKLFFDVYNSIHLKAENDPEKNRSGIGLENVKQRLQLLYPDRHELVIREAAKEFFIHLTMQLN